MTFTIKGGVTCNGLALLLFYYYILENEKSAKIHRKQCRNSTWRWVWVERPHFMPSGGERPTQRERREGRGGERERGWCPENVSTLQLKFLVAPLPKRPFTIYRHATTFHLNTSPWYTCTSLIFIHKAVSLCADEYTQVGLRQMCLTELKNFPRKFTPAIWNFPPEFPFRNSSGISLGIFTGISPEFSPGIFPQNFPWNLPRICVKLYYVLMYACIFKQLFLPK